MAVNQVDDKTFSSVLEDSDRVVAKFYANWCGSCRLFKPKFNRLSNEEDYQDITFIDVNAEESPEARKIAGANNLPFFTVFKKGNKVASLSTTKEEEVRSLINNLLED